MRASAGPTYRQAGSDRPPSFDLRPDAARLFGGASSDSAQRRRVPRVFSAAELRAIERLRQLGATRLPIDCTDGEIRSAYRALARRYHPDAHPQASASDRARYTRLFAEVSDAYRLLYGGA